MVEVFAFIAHLPTNPPAHLLCSPNFPRSHYAAIPGNTRQYADDRPFSCRVLPPNSSRIAAYPIFLPHKITLAPGCSGHRPPFVGAIARQLHDAIHHNLDCLFRPDFLNQIASSFRSGSQLSPLNRPKHRRDNHAPPDAVCQIRNPKARPLKTAGCPFPDS
jgi:hypothetical protein